MAAMYVALPAFVLVLVWLAAVGAFDDWLKLTAARRAIEKPRIATPP